MATWAVKMIKAATKALRNDLTPIPSSSRPLPELPSCACASVFVVKKVDVTDIVGDEATRVGLEATVDDMLNTSLRPNVQCVRSSQLYVCRFRK